MAKKDYTPGGNLTQAFVDLLDAGNAQAQLIMKAIAQHADWTTGETICGVRSLAEISKCSMKTVRRYLKKMDEQGLIALRQRYQDDPDDNGRQTTSKITLVGYAEWVAANRTGGTVKRPAKVAKYDGPPPGQSDQGQSGTPEERGVDPLDNLTTGPVDKLSAPHGHLLSTPPGQQVSSQDRRSNLVDNSPPLTPPRKRGGARARAKSNSDFDVDQLLGALRKEPDWHDVTVQLIEPVLRQRKFLAPDPAYVLRALAEWACDMPVPALKAAAFKILETRYSAVEGEHFVAAIRAVHEGLDVWPKLSRPTAIAVQADGLINISERESPEAFAAWMAHHEALLRERKPNHYALGSQHRWLREATLFPPSYESGVSKPNGAAA